MSSIPSLISHPLFLYLSRFLLSLGVCLIVYPFRSTVWGFLHKFIRTDSVEAAETLVNTREIRRQSLYLSLGIVPVAIFIGLTWWATVVLFVLCLVFLPKWFERRARQALHKHFDAALPDSLMGLASSLQAGLTLQKSLEVAVKATHPVFAAQASQSLKEYALGIPIDVALDNLRGRIPTPASNMAFGAMIIGRQLGGPLPLILSRIAATVRERLRVEGRLKALTSQGKAQGYILCGAPFVVGGGMAIMDPDKFRLLTDTLPGQVILAVAVLLWVVGVVVTWRVMQLDI